MHELFVGFHKRPQLDHGQLIEERHVLEFHGRQRQQVFLFGQHGLQEVLVYHGLRRDIELHFTKLTHHARHLQACLKYLMKSALDRRSLPISVAITKRFLEASCLGTGPFYSSICFEDVAVEVIINSWQS